MSAGEIHVPDLGEFSEVLIIDVMVKAGDSVEVETPLITLETDKATMDVPSPVAGVISALHVAKGDRVSTGDLLATLEQNAAVSSEEDAPTEEKAPAPADDGEKPAADAGGAEAAEHASAKAPKAEPEAPTEDTQATAPAGSTARPEPAPARPPAAAPSRATPSPSPSTSVEKGFAAAHAGPSVRAFARELGVDLGRVRGSGRKGRITADDVKAYVKSVLASAEAHAAHDPDPSSAGLPRVPAVDFAKFGPVEVVPLTRIQRISGPRLHASWVNLPHVTQFEEADITELEEARRSLKLRAANEGIALTSLAFVLRACVLALQEFPRLGASLDESGDNLVMKKYCHLGFAADTPQGLVVPVIRDADRMDVFELARSLGELSAKARDGKLSATEMQGGCFTVSNLGGIGGTAFTPIINAPEVAILGVSRARLQPVFDDDEFVPRLKLPLSLSYDHRVIDGAVGARFTAFLAKVLADIPLLMKKPSK